MSQKVLLRLNFLSKILKGFTEDEVNGSSLLNETITTVISTGIQNFIDLSGKANT